MEYLLKLVALVAVIVAGASLYQFFDYYGVGYALGVLASLAVAAFAWWASGKEAAKSKRP